MIDKRFGRITALSLMILIIIGQSYAEEPFETVWIRQIGTASEDWCSGVSADAMDNVYTCGNTTGLLGSTSFGGSDAFIAKINSAGVFQWIHQFGTDQNEGCSDITTDEMNNIYICGSTSGLLGSTSFGGSDAFIAKFNSAGVLQWIHQFGTENSDYTEEISTDELGNVYVGGNTYGSLQGTHAGLCDIFIAKFNSEGVLQWTVQYGTAYDDWNTGLSTDGLGNVYVSGYTYEYSWVVGGFEHSDGFVRKYNSSGNLQWAIHLETGSEDNCSDVIADYMGNVFVVGETLSHRPMEPELNPDDVFISNYNSNGILQWTHPAGTEGYDFYTDVSTDGLGSVYVSGLTDGWMDSILPPPPDGNYGDRDVFVSKYENSGVFHWTHQFGTSEYEYSTDIFADNQGYVYVCGNTDGWLDSFLPPPLDGNYGERDAFVVKLYIPTPTVIADAGPDQEVSAAVIDMVNMDDPPPGYPVWQVSAEGAKVILDASNSAPSYGSSIVSYKWTWTLGNDDFKVRSSNPNSEIILPSGTHTITLTVEDDLGITDIDEVIITVLDTIPGDINNDGAVNMGDFFILRTYYGVSR